MFFTKSKIKDITISAVVTRADGTIQDLGVIARRKRNIFREVFNKWRMLFML